MLWGWRWQTCGSRQTVKFVPFFQVVWLGALVGAAVGSIAPVQDDPVSIVIQGWRFLPQYVGR